MKYLAVVFGLLAALLVSTGCVGERVQVPPGSVGMVFGPDGLEEGVHAPGSFRLPYCHAWSACPYLVTVQVATESKSLTVDQVFLRRSNIPVTGVEIGVQFRVKQELIQKVLAESNPVNGESGKLVDTDQVWNRYIQRKISDAILTVLRDKTVEQLLTETKEIGDECVAAANEMLADKPVEIVEVGFPNGIDIPETVLDAKNALFAVSEERARDIASLEAELEIESHRQAVQLARVKNDKLAAAHAEIPFDVYMQLKVNERRADALEAMAAAMNKHGAGSALVSVPQE